MSTVINTNLASLYAQNNLTNAQGALAQSVQRLSSGLRINSARDDAAGLSIAQSMQSQINGLSQSVRNLNDATNLLQTADSSLSTVQDMLLRLKQLAVQGYDSSLSGTQRTNIATEMKDLNSEINATATRTKFNGINLVGSSLGISTPLSDVKQGSILTDSSAWAFADGTLALGQANSAALGGTTTTDAYVEITNDVSSEAYAKMAGVTYTFTYGNDGANITLSAVSDWDGSGNSTVYGQAQTLAVSTVSATGNGASPSDVSQVLDFSNFGIKLHLTTTIAAGDTKVLGSAIALDLDAATFAHDQNDTSGAAVKITNIDTSNASYGAGTYTLTDSSGVITNTYVDANGNSQTFDTTLTDSMFDTANQNTTIDLGFGIKATLHNYQKTTAADVATFLTSTDSGYSFDGDGTGDNTGQIVISGSANSKLDFQSGATSSAYISINTMNVSTTGSGASEMSAIGNGIASGGIADLGSTDSTATWQAAFKDLETSIDTALEYISSQRAIVGSQMNRLSYIISNLGAQSVNTQNSRSAIIDTDFAAETAKLTKGQIMQQAATAMLAQANQMPNVILSLLK